MERTLAAKLTNLWLLIVKINMDIAGLNFEPCPLNFENQYNFRRCSNDAKMIF